MLLLASFFAFVLALFPHLAWATINNQCEEERLSESAHQFTDGYYTISNVQTKETIAYKNSAGHWFYPSSSDSAASLELKSSENSSFAWTSIQVDGTNKCASAQWNYTYCAGNGCDWAAVLYRCAIDENAYEGSTVNVNKQYWLFVPSETTDDAYYIVALDHLKDMATRGWKSCIQTTTDTGVQSTCLEELDYEDTAFQWYVTPISGDSPTTSSTSTSATSTSTTKTTTSTSTSKATTTTTSNSNATATVTKTKTKTVTKTVSSCPTTTTTKAKRALEPRAAQTTTCAAKQKRALNRRAAEATQVDPEWPAIRRRDSSVQEVQIRGAPTIQPTPAPTGTVVSKFLTPGRGMNRA